MNCGRAWERKKEGWEGGERAFNPLAKINYRRLSGPVRERYPFSRDIGIPRTRSRRPPDSPGHAAFLDPRLAHPKQIRGHFSVPCPAYIPSFLLPWRRVFRAAKKAPGGGSRLVSPLSGRRTKPGYRMRRDGTVRGCEECDEAGKEEEEGRADTGV